MTANLNWEYKSQHELLVACVGYNYGPTPADRLDDIRREREHNGRLVASRMGLRSSDIVMDLGSGCGFVARPIARACKQVYCADISPDFLRFCEQELAEFPNVSCQLLSKYADFSALEGKGINRVYSTAVWIHFNFYDMYHHLTALHRLIPVGGSLYFDYADPSGITPGAEHSERILAEHLSAYRHDRETIFTLVQYNSLSAVQYLLDRIGFRLTAVFHHRAALTSVLAERL
jgi:cyclopropane fatty-acyl-phospholipid synthase-like methyltransferase